MVDVFEVQEILRSRQAADGGTEYKIRWKGFGSSEDTWEPEENLIHCEEILNAFKKTMTKERTTSLRKTPLNTPVTSRLRALAGEDTKRSSSVPSKETEATPVLQRTRLRQRNTPKVQRLLGVKHMPSRVAFDKPEDSEQTKSSGNKISSERPVRCNKWGMLAGLVCILISVLLFYLTMD